MNSLVPNATKDNVRVNLNVAPSLTYKVKYATDGQINGYTDGLEAVKQAIYKMINTERYEYIVYSWNYGIELLDLFGQPIPYVYAEIQRRITEALLVDDRVLSVYNFKFSNHRDDVLCTFAVDTVFGSIEGIERTVNNIV